jgi:hypothetical protein
MPGPHLKYFISMQDACNRVLSGGYKLFFFLIKSWEEWVGEGAYSSCEQSEVEEKLAFARVLCSGLQRLPGMMTSRNPFT